MENLFITKSDKSVQSQIENEEGLAKYKEYQQQEQMRQAIPGLKMEETLCGEELLLEVN